MSVFQEQGEVIETRRITPTGLLVVEFIWVSDSSTGNAVAELTAPLEGRLMQFECIYQYDGDPPDSYNIYLYCELGTDWLDGLGAGLTTYQVVKALYESHAGTAVARTPIMGLPTFYADAFTAGDRGTVQLILDPNGAYNGPPA